MSRSRKYGEDLTYAEEHRVALPELYGRIGHRLDVLDRDWTEYCNHCKAPLALYEEVRDVGQDLRDKNTGRTRTLAARATLPAFLLPWRNERPRHVQIEVDRLNQRLRALEREYPIIGFTARPLHLGPGRRFVSLTPEQWWEQVLLLHRKHHERCPRAQRAIREGREFPVRGAAMRITEWQHPLHVPSLFDVDEGQAS